MKVFVRSDIGKVRPINEDAYYMPKQGERFCAIADGMGGHNAGEVASAMAVSIFSEELGGMNEADGQAMRHAVECANARIHEKSMEAGQCNGIECRCIPIQHHCQCQSRQKKSRQQYHKKNSVQK